MRIEAAGLDGLYTVTPEPVTDERGFFARTWCADSFARAGLPTRFVQHSVSRNARRGTLRGLHWQAEPHPEGKLVRCTRGAIWDVALDLRAGSPTHGQWRAFELDERTLRALYIPPGFAHGFVTLADDTDVAYQMTEPYHPALARGVRWNDPAFGIDWPVRSPTVSPRDAAYPDYRP